MTETYLDDLLDELVPQIVPREDWPDVLGRARRAHRRRGLTIAVIAALALVPAGLAVGGRVADWFEGKPAPAVIRQDFIRFNGDMQQLAAGARAGMARSAPQAIVAQAHGVFALKTADGPVYLWAAPRRGGGTCWMIQLAATRNQTDGGCDETSLPTQALSFGEFGTITYPSEQFILGRAFDHAGTVVIAFSNGQRTTLPVVEGLFIGAYPKHVHPLEVSSYDRVGARIAVKGTLAGGTATLTATERRALSRVSAPGTPFRLPSQNPAVRRLIASGYEPTARLLGARAGRNYFRLTLKNGGAAYGTGRVGLASGVGKLDRPAGPHFPSVDNPLLDLSTIVTTKPRHIRFVHVGGIAADGVTRVVVKDREGRGLLWLPVHGNIYDSGTVPIPAGATQLVADDATGQMVARVPR